MMRFHPVVLLVVLTLGCAGGCHCLQHTYMPMACCDSWDPVLGSCHQCGLCGGDCEGQTPVSALKHTLTCASGCGEIYWGEWRSDPPDACDPCNNHGEWVGHSSPGPFCWDRVVSGWCHFWGYPGDPCGGCSAGCDECALLAAPLAKQKAVNAPEPSADPAVPEPQVEQDTALRAARRHPRQQIRIRSARLAR